MNHYVLYQLCVYVLTIRCVTHTCHYSLATSYINIGYTQIRLINTTDMTDYYRLPIYNVTSTFHSLHFVAFVSDCHVINNP